MLEKVLPAVSDEKYPQCVDGKNACPPDDCGGPWGYDNLLKVMKNPKNPEACFFIGYDNVLATGFDCLEIVPPLLVTADSISFDLASASSDVISGEIIYVNSYIFMYLLVCDYAGIIAESP